MRTVALDELEKHVADYVRLAEGGEVVVVTDVGRPVARLVPLEAGPGDEDPDDTILRELVAEGLATPAKAPRGTVPPSFGLVPFEELMKELDEDRAER
jgi:prevent-host-death family protein